jgi:hypothetical protein
MATHDRLRHASCVIIHPGCNPCPRWLLFRKIL